MTNSEEKLTVTYVPKPYGARTDILTIIHLRPEFSGAVAAFPVATPYVRIVERLKELSVRLGVPVDPSAWEPAFRAG